LKTKKSQFRPKRGQILGKADKLKAGSEVGSQQVTDLFLRACRVAGDIPASSVLETGNQKPVAVMKNRYRKEDKFWEKRTN